MEVNRVGIDLFKNLLSPDARSAHLLAFAAAFGAQTWVTFAQGPLLLANLPRQQFGNLMEKMHPTYFSVNAALTAFCVGTLAWDHAVIRKHPFDIFDVTVYQAFTLATCAASNLINGLAIGPASYKLLNDRNQQEKIEGKSYTDEGISDKLSAINKEFAGLQSISTILNFASIGGLVFHGLWLAKKGLPWSSIGKLGN